MIRRLVDAIGNISFSRGLALGALVGAAIAGSTLWSRLRSARTSGERRNDESTTR